MRPTAVVGNHRITSNSLLAYLLGIRPGKHGLLVLSCFLSFYDELLLSLCRSSSTKQNWWGAFANDDRGDQTSQAGIQTDGRILHYPAGSKWLNTAGDSDVRFFINHEGRHIMKNNFSSQPEKMSTSKEISENFNIDVSKESLQRLTKSDIFSPMSDPLHRKNKHKKNDSLSVSSSVSARSRK